MLNADLEMFLHIPCTISEFGQADCLPIYLRGLYTFQKVEIANVEFLAAEPVEAAACATMRKHRVQIMELTGLECAFVLERPTAYTKQKLLENGIPFIRPGKEIYLPFLGITLARERQCVPKTLEQISFLTQKMLLLILYQRIRSSTPTDMANLLGVTRMSGTRCFDEVEGALPQLIRTEGKRRLFVWEDTWQAYYEIIRQWLRNPVIKEYRLEAPLEAELPAGGMSAVSIYSMLNDNAYPTYAVTKAKATKLRLATLAQVPQEEPPAELVQVIGYEYPFTVESSMAVDPVTAILSLTDTEKEDPRVEAAINEILEAYIYNERP